MLLDGINHVAVLTADTDRFVAFYRAMFDATILGEMREEGVRLTIVGLGASGELNVFEIAGNDEAAKQVPMFGRGRLDHLALQAPTLEAFDEIRDRLVAAGVSDGFVTDFGLVLSIFFRDPDGLEAEVCVANPDAQPGVLNPPGTPARRYHPEAAS
jgi:catechol 2,3-dioxygenase-like lactoylglutathione lyase family enzyme